MSITAIKASAYPVEAIDLPTCEQEGLSSRFWATGSDGKKTIMSTDQRAKLSKSPSSSMKGGGNSARKQDLLRKFAQSNDRTLPAGATGKTKFQIARNIIRSQNARSGSSAADKAAMAAKALAKRASKGKGGQFKPVPQAPPTKAAPITSAKQATAFSPNNKIKAKAKIAGKSKGKLKNKAKISKLLKDFSFA